MTHEHVLALVAKLWSTTPWAPEAQRVFLAEIASIDADDAFAAVRTFYANDPRGFRPTVGQLRALIQVPQLERAERGWLAFVRAVEHYAGRPAPECPDMPNFPDERVAEAVRVLGGFRIFLGGIPSEERERWHARFLKAYRGERASLPPAHPPLELPAELTSRVGGGAK